MLTLTPTDHPKMPDEAEKPSQGFKSGGNQLNSKTMVVWVEGLDRGEANQRLAPMTSASESHMYLACSLQSFTNTKDIQYTD